MTSYRGIKGNLSFDRRCVDNFPHTRRCHHVSDYFLQRKDRKQPGIQFVPLPAPDANRTDQ